MALLSVDQAQDIVLGKLVMLSALWTKHVDQAQDIVFGLHAWQTCDALESITSLPEYWQVLLDGGAFFLLLARVLASLTRWRSHLPH